MRLIVLIGLTVLVWAGAAAVAGPDNWLPSGMAAVVCLLPAVGTLLVAGLTERQAPATSIGFILVAPLIRLVLVLVIGGLVGIAVPAIKAEPARFVFWVAGFYLLTLVVETAVLLTATKPKAGSPAAAAPIVPTDS